MQHLEFYHRHITSEFLKDRYPYLEDIRGHLKADDVSIAAGDRLFPRLVEQLKSSSITADELVKALRLVCDSCYNQEHKCEAIASDIVAAATNLLLHDHIPVRREAARVISIISLLMCGRHQLPIGNATLAATLSTGMDVGPTLQRLAKLLLGCDDELVKMHVAEAICAITLFRDGCQQVVDQSTTVGIAQYLCATLTGLPQTQELSLCLLHLLTSLGAVTMYAKDGLRDLLGIGLIAKVVGFLAKVQRASAMPDVGVERSTEITRQALRLLWNCGNDPKARKETLKADGVSVVTLFLVHPDARVREAAVCALNVMSLETEGKKHVLQHSIQAMAMLLHSDEETVYLQESCVQLCRSASELPAFRLAFARQVLRSVWLLEKIYGNTALAVISLLLGPDETATTQAEAVNVMAHFLQGAASQPVGDVIRVPPVASNVSSPAAYAIEECVDILHNLVALLTVAKEPALSCLRILMTVDKTREQVSNLIADGLIRIPDEFDIKELA